MPKLPIGIMGKKIVMHKIINYVNQNIAIKI